MPLRTLARPNLQACQANTQWGGPLGRATHPDFAAPALHVEGEGLPDVDAHLC